MKLFHVIRRAIPEGSGLVGLGVIVAGVGTYVFLASAGRALGASRFGALATVWAALYIVAPSLFYPIEQELARAVAHRRATASGAGPVIVRAGVAAAGIVLVALVAALVVRDRIYELFDGDGQLVIAVVIGVVGTAGLHLLRGALAGSKSFRAYGFLVAGEALLRVAGAVALLVVGSRTPGHFALVAGIAPLVTSVIALAGSRRLIDAGPPARWRELSTAVMWLFGASTFTALFLNVGPLVVRGLVGSAQHVEVGQFNAAWSLARVPLFLFIAVHASLLPGLTGMHAGRRYEEFRSAVRRLLGLIMAIALVEAVGIALLGKLAMRLLFGPSFILTTTELLILGAAGIAVLLATTSAQALLALSRHRSIVVGWLSGVLVAVGVGVALDGVIARVGLALFAGAATASVWMLVSLRATVASRAAAADGSDLPGPVVIG